MPSAFVIADFGDTRKSGLGAQYSMALRPAGLGGLRGAVSKRADGRVYHPCWLDMGTFLPLAKTRSPRATSPLPRPKLIVFASFVPSVSSLRHMRPRFLHPSSDPARVSCRTLPMHSEGGDDPMEERDSSAPHQSCTSQLALFTNSRSAGDWSVPRALIVREPWASMIVFGTKRWEIRGTATTIRGPIAIAARGTGTIVGVCRIVDVRGPLSLDEYADSWKLRGGDAKADQPLLPYARTYAWVLADPRAVSPEVPYRHPSGAVIWVKLPLDTQERLRMALLGSVIG